MHIKNHLCFFVSSTHNISIYDIQNKTTILVNITRCVSIHECNFQHKMSCHETSLTSTRNKKHYIKSCMQNLKKKHETKNKQHVLF